jgi:hypothetical protein
VVRAPGVYPGRSWVQTPVWLIAYVYSQLGSDYSERESVTFDHDQSPGVTCTILLLSLGSCSANLPVTVMSHHLTLNEYVLCLPYHMTLKDVNPPTCAHCHYMHGVSESAAGITILGVMLLKTLFVAILTTEI